MILRRLRTPILLFTAVLSGGLIGVAQAGTINIGNGASGSNPLGQNTPQDPVLIGNGKSISIAVQGSAMVSDQILLAILIPNDTTNVFGGVNPIQTVTKYANGLPTPTGTGSSSPTARRY